MDCRPLDGLQINPSKPAFENVLAQLGTEPALAAFPFLLKDLRFAFFIFLVHFFAPRNALLGFAISTYRTTRSPDRGTQLLFAGFQTQKAGYAAHSLVRAGKSSVTALGSRYR